MAGAAGDRTLMPEFPWGWPRPRVRAIGMPVFPFNSARIREKDENIGGASRHAASKGVHDKLAARAADVEATASAEYTALRFPDGGLDPKAFENRLLSAIDPASVDLSFQAVREQALAAGSQSMDFGGIVHRIQLLSDRGGAVVDGAAVSVWAGAACD